MPHLKNTALYETWRYFRISSLHWFGWLLISRDGSPHKWNIIFYQIVKLNIKTFDNELVCLLDCHVRSQDGQDTCMRTGMPTHVHTRRRALTHTHTHTIKGVSLIPIHHLSFLWLEPAQSWWISSALTMEVSCSVLFLMNTVSSLLHQVQFSSQS